MKWMLMSECSAIQIIWLKGDTDEEWIFCLTSAKWCGRDSGILNLKGLSPQGNFSGAMKVAQIQLNKTKTSACSEIFCWGFLCYSE